jgi:parallel beta-helix repeat protein
MRLTGERSGLLAAPAILLALTILLSPTSPNVQGPSHGVTVGTAVVYRSPQSQNWVVNSTLAVTNQTLVENGNVTVESAGTLTLENDTLIMNGTSDGEYSITVDPGGAVYLNNTTVESGVAHAGYAFQVDGSKFVMEGSEVRGAGWCSDSSTCYHGMHSTSSAGLIVETSGATIRHSTFAADSLGLSLEGSSETVENSAFLYDSVSSLSAIQGADDVISGDLFEENLLPHSGTQIIELSSAQNSLLANNTLTYENLTNKSDFGPGNPFTGNDYDGIILASCSNISVLGNHINVATMGVFPGQSANITVANNTIGFGGFGVAISSGVNQRIVGNVLSGMGTGAIDAKGEFPPAVGAIRLELVENSVVAGNKVLGNSTEGMYCVQSENNSILNNVIQGNLQSNYGILLYSCQRNVFSSNTIAGASYGLFADGYSNGNRIANNSIGSLHSITIVASFNNTIFRNDFYDGTGAGGGPYDSGSNSWFLSNSGNYWSYYSGINPNGSGFGDNPYVRESIPPNGTEPYSPVTRFPSVSAAVPVLAGIPPPILATSPATTLHIIRNQTLFLGSGYIAGSLTVINSTLILGRNGTVSINSGGSTTAQSTVTIENSRILDAGYGSVMSVYSPQSNLTIINSTLQGVSMEDLITNDITVSGSQIIQPLSGVGLTVQGASSAIITNDTISNDLVSIGTYTDPAITGLLQISGNRIENTLEHGMNVGVARTHSIIISDNNVSSRWGDGIDTSGNAAIVGNTLYGVGIGAQGGSRITDNTVVGAAAAINLLGTGTVVYHNNLVNTSAVDPASDSTGTNQWDFGGEGNYWSVYTGTDPDLDGIGDTPFVIPNANGATDHYPFMRENGWLTRFYLSVNTNVPVVPFTVDTAHFETYGGTEVIPLGYDEQYNVSFPQTIALTNATRLAFSGWQGSSFNGTERAFNLSSNATIRVNYTNEDLLTLGASFGNVSGGGWYSPGSTADIRYSPVGGYRFVDWVSNSSAVAIANPTSPSTSVTINGPGTVVARLAEVTYVVTFTETGLPSGTNWTVALNGTVNSSSTTSITFTEPNNTYSFSIGPVVGYTVNLSAGSITVNATAIQRSVSFTATSETARFLGLPVTEGYALLGAIVAVVLVGVVVAVVLRRRRAKSPQNAGLPPSGGGSPPSPP